MSTKTIIGGIVAAVIVIAVIVVAIAKFGSEDDWICENGQWIRHGNPSAEMPTSGCGETVVNEEENKANILVASPADNAEVNSPFTFGGEARVFENQLNWRLTDANGTVLSVGTTYANSPDVGQFGSFSQDVYYVASSTIDGLLEVFDYSAENGEEIDKVSVPIKLLASEPMTVKVFFSNDMLDPAVTCTKVFPVEREIDATSTPAYAALLELLSGPTTKEQQEEYSTSINKGVKINSVNIINGTVTVDFDKKLEEKVAGSCLVSAIRAQITETLKQFPFVQDVIIAVDGETEKVLQP